MTLLCRRTWISTRNIKRPLLFDIILELMLWWFHEVSNIVVVVVHTTHIFMRKKSWRQIYWTGNQNESWNRNRTRKRIQSWTYWKWHQMCSWSDQIAKFILIFYKKCIIDFPLWSIFNWSIVNRLDFKHVDFLRIDFKLRRLLTESPLCLIIYITQ